MRNKVPIRRNIELRRALIKAGALVPHPIPCRLVKDGDGNWVEGAWSYE